MPEIPNEHDENRLKVVHEIVAFRYSDEESLMLVGEAEVMIEMLSDGSDETDIYTNIQYVRVDVLTTYDAYGNDVFAEIMDTPTLKHALEAAALEHFFHPPRVPVSLPKSITEW